MCNYILYFIVVYVLYITHKCKAAEDWDLKRLKSSRFFIDKTLFIKYFFRNDRKRTRFLVVWAPPQSGKSAAAFYLKKFANIVVNKKGEVVPHFHTKNYHTFCAEDHTLKICQDQKFYNRHAGQYPVLHLDLSPLRKVVDMASVVTVLRLMLREAYLSHIYLLKSKHLWYRAYRGTRQLFTEYLNCEVTDDYLMKNGFDILIELLYEHFQRNILVIIENYDSFFTNMLLNDIEERQRVMKYVAIIVEKILKHSTNVDRALVTGVYRISENGTSPDPFPFTHYRFLDDYRVSKYFGFTKKDVAELFRRESLATQLPNDTVRHKEFYGAYLTRNTQNEIYSMGSTLNYFLNRQKINPFFKNTLNIQDIFVFFSVGLVEETLKKLLIHDGFLQVKIDLVLTSDTLDYLKGVWYETDDDYKIENLGEPWIHSYLFDSGYLSHSFDFPIDIKKKFVNVPNKEMYIALCHLLLTAYKLNYNYYAGDIFDIRKHMTYINAQNKYVNVKRLQRVLTKTIRRSKHFPQNERDLLSVLYLSLVTYFPNVTTNLHHTLPKNAITIRGDILTRRDNMDIIMENVNGVKLIFTAKLVNATKYKTLDDEHVRDDLLQLFLVYNSYFKTQNSNNDWNLFIIISYDIKTRGLALTCQPSNAVWNPKFFGKL